MVGYNKKRVLKFFIFELLYINYEEKMSNNTGFAGSAKHGFCNKKKKSMSFLNCISTM